MEMSGRILAIISLFVVLAVTAAKEKEKGGGKCSCIVFSSGTNDPTAQSQTLEITTVPSQKVAEGEWESLDCDDESSLSSCLTWCEDYLNEQYKAKHLSDDPELKLGRWLCELENVGISYAAPRHIFIKPACDTHMSDPHLQLGDLCCIMCDGEIYYNRGCSSEPKYPIMTPGEYCEV